ncbi:MAG: carbohydrate ABC transporter permease [Candidatus Atribacteria bacterium]|nr:carbohydrate ABC transporter permease [Candidatus Atribacteria bacterium]MCD6349523.1 carbohydrate ABC transporter permease [Candidatus Atribacteria bacterium]
MKNKKVKAVFLYVLIVLVVAFSLSPFLWQVITSFKPSQEIFSRPVKYLPSHIDLSAYSQIFIRHPFGRQILNSIVIASISTFLCLFVASLAAYAVARFKIMGGRSFLLFILLLSLFPPVVLIVPLYEMVGSWGLMNNWLALIIPYASLNLPFAIWVMNSFFQQIPGALEDAARVDGLSRLGILVRIILPLSAPALATTAILVFIFCWNEFLLALTFMTRDTARTVPVGIAMLSGASQYEIPWDQISAATVLTTLPLVTFVILFQRKIVEGLTAGAVKG